MLTLPAWFGHSNLMAAPTPRSAAPAPGPAANGQRLFADGKQAAEAKQWSKALDLFHRAYEVLPSYDVAANLGHVALKLNKNAEAARYLWISLESFPPSEKPERRRSIHDLFLAAKRNSAMVIPKLRPEDAELLVDGELLRRSASEPVFLDPGKYFLTAEAEGYKPVSQYVQAVAGGEMTLTFELPKSPDARVAAVSSGLDRPNPSRRALTHPSEPPPTSSASPMVHGSELRLGLIIGGSATVAALGVGLGYTLSARESRQDADRLVREVGGPSGCEDSALHPGQCARLMDAADSVDRKTNISYVAYGVAGAAVLGTVTYLFWPGLSRSSSNSAALGPSVFIGASSTELAVTGQF